MSRARNSRQTLTNLFPISGLENQKIQYRQWRVKNLSPDDEAFEQNRVILRRNVSKDVGGLAEVFIANNADVRIAVPEGKQFKEPQSQYSLIPSVAKLELLEHKGTLDFSSTANNQIHLATRFLSDALQSLLWRKKTSLWQPKSGRPFFSKKPSNQHDNTREVDVFEGLQFRVKYVKDVGYCLMMDCRTRYVSTTPWPEIIPFDNRWDYVRRDPDANNPQLTHCVYKSGLDWFEILVKSVRRESIDETTFLHPISNQPVTVYEWTINRWKHDLPEWCDKLNAAASTITFSTWRDGEPMHGISNLCYPIIRTSDLEQRGLGYLQKRYAIKPPDIRWEAIVAFITDHLNEFQLGEIELQIRPEPVKISGGNSRFFVPSLEFGNSKTLSFGSGSKESFRHYPKKRMEYLRDEESGFYKVEALLDQWALVPDRIRNTVWPAFRQDLAREIRYFTRGEIDYRPQYIRYSDFGTHLSEQANSIEQAINRQAVRTSTKPTGYCIAILDHDARHDLPAYLTSQYSNQMPPLYIACIHLQSFEKYYKQNKVSSEYCLDSDSPDIGQARSYIRNVALKILLLNQQWPFVFSNNSQFNSSLYIGVDVLNGVAGYTFLGNGGRICIFDSADVINPEKVSRRRLMNMLIKHIAQLPNLYQWTPQKVVLLRDGRLFASELSGFSDAMKKMNIKDAHAVEILKSTAIGVRFFQSTHKRSSKSPIYRNPQLGAWMKISDDEAAICTTGWPFTLQGTSMPLTIRRRLGNSKINELASDVFSLAQLAWTAPNLPARYPLVIRYTDLRLEAIASDFEQEDLEYNIDELDEIMTDTEAINE